MDYEKYMRIALMEARDAELEGEVPIGAVVVCGDKVIARAHNRTEHLHDVTAHAEIMAITAAEDYMDAKYLTDCTLFVTVEPCVMCAGAIAWAQVAEVVFGTEDAKRGFTRYSNQILHPKTKLTRGILADECEKIMKDFFARKRR
ncbi:MAG: nucleoside deaminase [Bacteroidales bacterium]|nr:nucleoside deaminase [Bacteroidales bacterium]